MKNEQQNLIVLITMISSILIFALAVIFLLIKPKRGKGTVMSKLRKVYYRGQIFDYRFSDTFNFKGNENYPEAGDIVKGYTQTYYDEEEPYDIFIIEEVIKNTQKEPVTVD